MKNLSIVILTFNFTLLTFNSAQGAIGVSPDNLEFNKNVQSQSLFLRNLGTETEQIEIRLEDEKFAKYISITPARTFLRASESLAVQITLAQRKNFSTNLEVIAIKPNPADLAIASGVKIPLISSAGFPLRAFIPLLSAFTLTSALYLVKRKKS